MPRPEFDINPNRSFREQLTQARTIPFTLGGERRIGRETVTTPVRTFTPNAQGQIEGFEQKIGREVVTHNPARVALGVRDPGTRAQLEGTNAAFDFNTAAAIDNRLSRLANFEQLIEDATVSRDKTSQAIIDLQKRIAAAKSPDPLPVISTGPVQPVTTNPVSIGSTLINAPVQPVTTTPVTPPNVVPTTPKPVTVNPPSNTPKQGQFGNVTINPVSTNPVSGGGNGFKPTTPQPISTNPPSLGNLLPTPPQPVTTNPPNVPTGSGGFTPITPQPVTTNPPSSKPRQKGSNNPTFSAGPPTLVDVFAARARQNRRNQLSSRGRF